MPGRIKLVSTPQLPAEAAKALTQLGDGLRTARVRRRITQEDASRRLKVSRVTIREAERGSPSVGMGVYMQLAWLYGLHAGLSEALSPNNDAVGLSLERREGRQRSRTRVLNNEF